MADRVFRTSLVLTKSLFLYGTLRDPELYEIVSGVPLEARKAHLSDAAVYGAVGERFPILTNSQGAAAEGVLVCPTAAALVRLDFFQTGLGHSRAERVIETGEGPVQADIYVSDRTSSVGDLWSLPAWQDQHGALVRLAAHEYMTLMETHHAEEAARALPQILMRADSRLRARREPSPAPLLPDLSNRDGILPERTERPYTDYFAVREDWISFPRFNGEKSTVVKRASFLGGDAATVLPYDPNTESVLIIRQFRHGPFVRGDANPWALEPAAGRIDPGEAPEDTARRELQEETGVVARSLHFVGRYYPSPGAFSEYLYSFVAVADLSNADGGVGGLADEAEDIIRHVVPLEDAMALISSGAANTGPLILSLCWLALNKSRLS